MTEKRVCACRRALSETELFAAYGVGSARIVEHDAVPCEPAPLTVADVRERYARQEPLTILARLHHSERRLTVGGRS